MTASPQRFHDLLQQQLELAHQLLHILAQEHAAICGKFLEELETILADKQTQLTRLDTVSQEFLALLQDRFLDEHIDITAALRHHDPQGVNGLVSLWQQVEKALIQCRNSNSINGKIITINQHHTQLALSILRNGELGASFYYSPTGSRSYAPTSRTLGKV